MWATALYSAELVHLVVKSQPAENGKFLNMEFRETERTADASVVNGKFISGGPFHLQGSRSGDGCADSW